MQIEIKETKNYSTFTDGKYVSFIPESDYDILSIGKFTTTYKNYYIQLKEGTKLTSFDVDYKEYVNKQSELK